MALKKLCKIGVVLAALLIISEMIFAEDQKELYNEEAPSPVLEKSSSLKEHKFTIGTGLIPLIYAGVYNPFRSEKINPAIIFLLAYGEWYPWMDIGFGLVYSVAASRGEVVKNQEDFFLENLLITARWKVLNISDRFTGGILGGIGYSEYTREINAKDENSGELIQVSESFRKTNDTKLLGVYGEYELNVADSKKFEMAFRTEYYHTEINLPKFADGTKIDPSGSNLIMSLNVSF